MTRYQVGGAVRPGAVYVRRAADRQLPEALLRGELCQVLAPRQMGKSSLRLRVSEQLAQEGYRTATVDLSGLGTAGVTPEAWFAGLCGDLAAELDVPEPEPLPGGPLHGWIQFLGQILDADPEPVVLFFDEIDILRRLPFGGADLLGGIRAVYERRAHDPRWARLMVCVVGATTPDALAAASGGAPFNVGTRIELRDFTRAEADSLAEGLPDPNLLEAVYQWTSGHPYMTLRLCEELAREGADREAPVPRVARLVERLFLTGGPTGDVNLAAAGRELLHADGMEMERLNLYARLRRVPGARAEVRQGLAEAVELSGMVAERNGRLSPRNRIFAEVYDQAWVAAQLQGRPIYAAIRAWKAGGEQVLPTGAALQRLREWAEPRADLSPEESAFLLQATQAEMRQVVETSERLQRDERRDAAERLARVRGRLLIGLAVAGLLLALVALALARALDRAQFAAARATAEAHLATQLRLAAEASALAGLPRSAEVALARALEAVGAEPPEAAPAAVTRALADGLYGASGRRLAGHGHPVTNISCGADGTIVSRDAEGETRRWSVADGGLLQRWDNNDPTAPTSGPGLSARVAHLQATTGESGPLQTVPGPDGGLNWPSGSFTGALRYPDGRVRAHLYGPTQPGMTWGMSTRFGYLTADEGDVLWRWDHATGRALGAFRLLTLNPLDIDVCPDEQHVVVGSRDHTVSIWNVVGGAARLAFPEPDAMRLGWTGPTLLVGKRYTTWGRDLQTGERVVAPGPQWLPWEADPTLTVAADRSPLRLLGLRGQPDVPLEGAENVDWNCSRWSEDGRLLAVSDEQGAIRIWDADGRLVRTLALPGAAARCPTFSPDARRLVVGRQDAHSVLIDVPSGAIVRTLGEQRGTVRATRWNRDGSQFATASFDHTVGLWNADGSLVHLLRGQGGLVRAVAFSPDGRRVAAGGDDATVHVWDVATGEVVAVLRGHTGVVRALTFSPDGGELASVADDGMVLVFPASPDALVAAARKIVPARP